MRKKQKAQANRPTATHTLQGSYTHWMQGTHGKMAVAVFVLAAIVIFAGIGSQRLWQDEAQTALVARTILQYGVPHGFDGTNHFSQELGAEYGKGYIWQWHTWLQFYIIVPFFLLLGKSSTLAARLPFAIFGLATVILAYFAASEMFRSRKAGIFAALTLTLSVPYLILVRQCRYYAPSAFFTLLVLYAYVRMLDGKKRSWMWFVIAGTLLFHSWYVYCATVLAAVFVHALISNRAKLKLVASAIGAVAVLNLPWGIWFAMSSIGKSAAEKPSVGSFAWNYVKLIGEHAFSPFILALPVLIGLAILVRNSKLPTLDRRSVSIVSMLALVSAFIVIALSLASPFWFFRYLAPIIPLGALVTALILDRTHPAIGAAVLALLVLWSPARNLMDGTGKPNDVATYAYEITHHYQGPIDGIVEYLNKNAKPSDTVLITYGDLPLKYYTNLKIYGGLTGENLGKAKEADWVILRRNIICEKDGAVAQFIVENIKANSYAPVEIPTPDVAFENREEPGPPPMGHRYKSPTVEDAPYVVIYRRTERP